MRCGNISQLWVILECGALLQLVIANYLVVTSLIMIPQADLPLNVSFMVSFI